MLRPSIILDELRDGHPGDGLQNIPGDKLLQQLLMVMDIVVQLTSSRVRLGQSFKTVGCGCTSCWGDVGAGSVEAET